MNTILCTRGKRLFCDDISSCLPDKILCVTRRMIGDKKSAHTDKPKPTSIPNFITSLSDQQMTNKKQIHK